MPSLRTVTAAAVILAAAGCPAGAAPDRPPGSPWLAGHAAGSGCAATTSTPTPAPALTPTPASALAPTPSAGAVGGIPWTQLRYPPDRLAALATGRGVTVAVIDSGVDATYPQLAGRVLAGTDFLDPGGDGRRDCVGHGTAVASIVAAAPRPGSAVRGLAPDVRILPVRVSEQQMVDGRTSGRAGTPDQFAQAIRWSVQHHADVLNLSVVLYRDDPAVRQAVRYALAHDVVVVAAVGNLHEEGDPRSYPAAYPGVIGVGSIGPDGRRSSFSQVGPDVDVAAPGAEVTAAAGPHGAGPHDGTSYAAPFVSATAALVRQYRPTLNAVQVGERILAGTDPAPEAGAGYGAGVLDPERAMTERPGAPAAARPDVPVPAPDHDAARHSARRAAAHRAALLVASVAVLGALLSVAAAAVLPRGRRRRWAPPEGRTDPPDRDR
ncbi:type VII secretion-associated serine protease mycosin [Plantactinospora sp. KBS50]|uniref:type VII secretion-associated serine protease mycosin n=1 Tax=Plantactinospora sp. KBS50 TaxID=2024580 RepID=UPI000BAA9AC4|nr:type VII secretion-associated serine protease mycosin [Plantactinospora sp. KBS50]ASW53236.1 type VII secretion-associated serine protease mycosin [Plantactinospora sp. KBS50]